MTYNAFSRLKVIDCASWIAAPAAATILSDLGADVVKVEPPGTGDPYRATANQPGSPQAAHNYAWILGARNRRSLAIDLNVEAGQELLQLLTSRADVFITNYPHSVRKRLRVDYDSLAPLNERLVYASFTSYGEGGSERDRAGFDSTAWWARSGMMDLMRSSPDAAPPRPIYGIGDHPCGVTLYAAIVSALYQRELTGRGDYVSSSLIENGAWANGNLIQAALCGASIDRRRSREDAPSALGIHYRCKDGAWLLIALSNPERQWPILAAQVLNRADLITDPRFASHGSRQHNARELMAILDGIFAQRPLPEWTTHLEATGIPFGFVQTVDDVITDAQMRNSGALTPIDGVDMLTVGSPFQLRKIKKRPPSMPPTLGEHSAEILHEYGINRSVIGKLRQDGIIG